MNPFHYHILGVLLLSLSTALVVGCSDAGVDPDTATVIGGDVNDTIPQLDLQKASVSVGFVGGVNGNTVIDNFIRFERRVRYQLDTLDDGYPVRVRSIVLEAKLDSDEDEADADRSNPFHPMKGIRLEIPTIAIRPNGTGETRIIGPLGANQLDRAALRLSMVRPGERAELIVREDATTGDAGSVKIIAVDPNERTITMVVDARLNHERAEHLPRTIVLRMVFELPY